MWGEAVNVKGEKKTIRIITLEGYALTVVASVTIADHVLSHEPPSGFCTPAVLMGADFILTLPGTSLLTSPH